MRLELARYKIEKVELGRRPGHMHVNDALGLGGKMGRLDRKRILRRRFRRAGQEFVIQQRSQREGSQAGPAIPEKLAAAHRILG